MGQVCVYVYVFVFVYVHVHIGGNIFQDSDYTPDDGDVNKQYYKMSAQLFIQNCVGNV